jgi:small subunit ribosomal protein S16
MLMIRFQRIGRKNDPSFRMVVLEKTASPKAGTYADLVGTYHPKTKAFQADGEKIKGWMAKGAQLSPSLQNLLIAKGIIEGKKSALVVKGKNLTKNVKADLPAQAGEPAAPAEAAPAEPAAEEAPVAEAPAEEALAEVKEEAPTAA